MSRQSTHKISNLFKSLALLFGLLFVIGCSEDPTSTASFEENLYGKWQWAYTDTHNGHHSPSSDYRTERLEFDENGIIYEYVNDTLLFSGQYEVMPTSSTTEAVVLLFDTLDVDFIVTIDKHYKISGDSLFIRLNWTDLWESSAYSRIR